MNLKKNLLIFILLIFNCFVEIISAGSYSNPSFLKELKKCFETKNEYKCKEMILRTERMQLREYNKGNLKCQTILLGLQTELIRNFYFNKNQDKLSGKTIKSLIKNC